MVSFPAVKIGKQWKNILKEILKYLSGEPQEQVRNPKEDLRMLCLAPGQCMEQDSIFLHVPSSFPFPGLLWY